MKIYLISFVILLICSCIAPFTPSQAESPLTVLPLVDGECDHWKQHYLNIPSVHITKQLVDDQLKCVVDFYIQVGEQTTPITPVTPVTPHSSY